MTDTLTDQGAGPHLVVLSGFHAGARCALPLGACSIGSDGADAVVLGDPGVMPGHATLHVQAGSVTVRAAADAALDGADLPPGETFAAPLPFELALAGVVLRCEPAETEAAREAPAASPPRSLRATLAPVLRPRWRFPVLACTLAALGLPLGVMPVASDTAKAGPPTAAAFAPLPPLAPVPAPFEAPVHQRASPGPAAAPKAPGASNLKPSGLAAALQDLQAELSARSLAGIQLSASGGLITARGRLDLGSEPDWRLVQQWFDRRGGRYGREATLVDEVRFAAVPAAAVAVDAVWTGRNANVVIKGQRYFEGATLPSGFRLERIAPGELVVEREGQRQALKF